MQSMKISTDITHFLDTTRLAMAEAVLGVILLASVYAAQYLGGLQPCALCLYQRWPWWVATGLAILALVFRRHSRVQTVVVGLASLSILSLFTRTLAGRVSALVTSQLDVVASGNGCKEYLWIVVSEDCYVASRADLLPKKRVELRGRPTGKGSRSTAGGGELYGRSASERGGDQLQGRGELYGRSASERGGDQLQGRGELCVDPPAAGSKNCFVPASSQLSSSDWTVVKRLVVGRELHL